MHENCTALLSPLDGTSKPTNGTRNEPWDDAAIEARRGQAVLLVVHYQADRSTSANFSNRPVQWGCREERTLPFIQIITAHRDTFPQWRLDCVGPVFLRFKKCERMVHSVFIGGLLLLPTCSKWSNGHRTEVLCVDLKNGFSQLLKHIHIFSTHKATNMDSEGFFAHGW